MAEKEETAHLLRQLIISIEYSLAKNTKYFKTETDEPLLSTHSIIKALIDEIPLYMKTENNKRFDL